MFGIRVNMKVCKDCINRLARKESRRMFVQNTGNTNWSKTITDSLLEGMIFEITPRW